MTDELINLLPPARQHARLRDYYLRLGVIALAFVTALTLVAVVLLLPTHVFLQGSAKAKKAHLAAMLSTLSSADDLALSARLTALSDEAAMITALASARSVSETVRSVLALPRPGIAVSGLSFTPGTAKKPSTLAISGNAMTREALRRYQLTIQGAPEVSAAELPVSAYAKDTDIDFTITVTFVP